MIRVLYGMFMPFLLLAATVSVACDSGEYEFEIGNYVWLGDDLLPLPTSHFIHSIGTREIGEYGRVIEMHLNALQPSADVRSIIIRKDADVRDHDGFSWEQLREIGQRGETRKVVVGNGELLLVHYPGVPDGNKAIYESAEYQIVVSGQAACQMLLSILEKKEPDDYLAGE